MTTICVVVYFGEFVFVWRLGLTLSGIGDGGGAEGNGGWRGRGGAEGSGWRGGGGAEGSGGRCLIASGLSECGRCGFTEFRAFVGFLQ